MAAPKKNNKKAPQKKVSTSTLVIAGLALVFVVIIILNRTGKDDAPEMPPPMQSVPTSQTSGTATLAPDYQLESIEGGSQKISDYRGSVVMLNFWATWCGPCKREIPDFIELQKTYGPKGLKIVGVALDEPADVRSFVRANGLNYPVLIGNAEIAQAYGGVQSIPTTFLIDREGKIVTSAVGLRPKETWEQAIQGLL